MAGKEGVRQRAGRKTSGPDQAVEAGSGPNDDAVDQGGRGPAGSKCHTLMPPSVLGASPAGGTGGTGGVVGTAEVSPAAGAAGVVGAAGAAGAAAPGDAK